MVENDRYDRQVRLFGADGQARLEKSRVGIFGLGGLGSHVAQQLAYLGVGQFLLVDDDLVASTNLNRLIGATSANVGSRKTTVAERVIKSILPGAQVQTIDAKLPSELIEQQMAGLHVVVGCYDNDLPRLITTGYASARQIPYVDTATDIERDEHTGKVFYGGHVLVAGLQRGCLHCLNMLDQRQIRVARMDPEEREIEARVYGVPVESLLETGPSVVTLNGVIASLGATETMAILTGLPIGTKLQYFRGERHAITKSSDAPSQGCYYCDLWLGPPDNQ